MNQFILDQPSDEQFGLLEKIASDVIPKLREQTPKPTTREGVTIDTSRWQRPQDHVNH
jgi:hypothetical protein